MMKKMKIFWVLYNIEQKRQYTKYFESEFEKDKFKRKLNFSKRIIIIEDSTDTVFTE